MAEEQLDNILVSASDIWKALEAVSADSSYRVSRRPGFREIALLAWLDCYLKLVDRVDSTLPATLLAVALFDASERIGEPFDETLIGSLLSDGVLKAADNNLPLLAQAAHSILFRGRSCEFPVNMSQLILYSGLGIEEGKENERVFSVSASSFWNSPSTGVN